VETIQEDLGGTERERRDRPQAVPLLLLLLLLPLGERSVFVASSLLRP